MKLAPSHLERLAAYFSAVYPHCPGGIPEALGLVFAERKRIRGGDQEPRPDISRDVLESIVTTVASARGVKPNAILGHYGSREASEARAEAWVILLTAGYGPTQIGRAFDRNHSSVSKTTDRWRPRFEKQAEVRARIAWLSQASQQKREAA